MITTAKDSQQERVEAEYTTLAALVFRSDLFNGEFGNIHPELFSRGDSDKHVIQSNIAELVLQRIRSTGKCSLDGLRKDLELRGFIGRIYDAEINEVELWNELLTPERLKTSLGILLDQREIDLQLSRKGSTDYDHARRLIVRYGKYLRFNCTRNKWVVWKGSYWCIDDSKAIYRYAKVTARKIYEEVVVAKDQDQKALAKMAIQLMNEANIRAMLKMAESEPEIAMTDQQFDRNKYLLSCLNGTIDLKTGKLRASCREDYITKVIPVRYDASAKCPLWMNFLNRVMSGDKHLIGFLKRAVGYSLTGDISERALFICYGTGKNGKTTFLETLMAMLGDYALRTPTETLMSRRPGVIPNDVARLAGARFVTARETDEGRKLAEAQVKDLTGGDMLTARFMRAEWFDFKPECKLWLATNHKPVIRGTDRAIWDRIRLIPFSVTISDDEMDSQLGEKLKNELPGILTWAMEGCIQWQGLKCLGTPTAVLDATQEYRTDMDVIGGFLDECCTEGPLEEATAKVLYQTYGGWCDQVGEKPITQRRFGGSLTERGYSRQKGTGGVRAWIGIGLKEAKLP